MVDYRTTLFPGYYTSPFMFPFEISHVDESHMASLKYIDLNRFDLSVVLTVKPEPSFSASSGDNGIFPML